MEKFIAPQVFKFKGRLGVWTRAVGISVGYSRPNVVERNIIKNGFQYKLMTIHENEVKDTIPFCLPNGMGKGPYNAIPLEEISIVLYKTNPPHAKEFFEWIQTVAADRLAENASDEETPRQDSLPDLVRMPIRDEVIKSDISSCKESIRGYQHELDAKLPKLEQVESYLKVLRDEIEDLKKAIEERTLRLQELESNLNAKNAELCNDKNIAEEALRRDTPYSYETAEKSSHGHHVVNPEEYKKPIDISFLRTFSELTDEEKNLYKYDNMSVSSAIGGAPYPCATLIQQVPGKGLYGSIRAEKGVSVEFKQLTKDGSYKRAWLYSEPGLGRILDCFRGMITDDESIRYAVKKVGRKASKDLICQVEECLKELRANGVPSLSQYLEKDDMPF